CRVSAFFFSSRRRHTRFSRDWSSDVCSSDLGAPAAHEAACAARRPLPPSQPSPARGGRGLRTPCVPAGHPHGSPRMTPTPPALDVLLGDGSAIAASRTSGEGPPRRPPIDARMLREAPSGHLFGMTQNAGMGWRASEVGRDPYLIVSTQGGLRAEDGQPVALGLHTGHWELDQMVRTAARTLAGHGALPFAVACS